jgi:hypothetical protein
MESPTKVPTSHPSLKDIKLNRRKSVAAPETLKQQSESNPLTCYQRFKVKKSRILSYFNRKNLNISLSIGYM